MAASAGPRDADLNPMALRASLADRLQLPAIAAPMFLVSGPQLVIEACKAGIVGAMPSLNARSADQFREWLVEIDAALFAAQAEEPERRIGPPAINIIVNASDRERLSADLDAVIEHRVPVVITSVGSPREIVPRAHAYGGLVLHDVTTLAHARKAVDAGVDGLILVCSGAGGHGGTLNPFTFVPQVRRFYDGIVVVAGAISDGAAVRAALKLGADLAYIGTRFAASAESLASDTYKRMLVDARSDDVIFTSSISGMPANFLRSSLVAAGLDPDQLPPPKGFLRPDLPPGIKAWRDVWSGGHGVGLIDDAPPTADIVDRLRREYAAAS
jgi:nitronate monooxygenase